MATTVQRASRTILTYGRASGATEGPFVSHRYPHSASSSRFRLGGEPDVLRHSSTSSSSLPDDIVRPLKRSPYRLLPLPTFLSSFAPLHVAGWRLVNLAPAAGDPSSEHKRLEKGIGTLEGKKLVRAYAFPREGYSKVMELVQRIGRAVEEENHHPVITICSASDYPNTSSLPISDDKSEHIVEIATHTHTPLPETKAAAGENIKPGPGVTGKDLHLAEKVERAWTDIQAGMQV